MFRATALTLAAAALTAGASTAHAGTYEVVSCGLADGFNLSWTLETNNPSIRATDRCGSDVEDDADSINTYNRALGVRTVLGAPDLPVGAAGYLRFEVPAGLTIVALRSAGRSHASSESWLTVTETNTGVISSCQSATACVGDPNATDDPGGPTSAIPISPPALWVRRGFRCTQAPCEAGVSIHDASRAMWAAGVTVSDQTLPVAALGSVPASVVNGDVLKVAVSGSDQTGTKRLELLVDGVAVGSSDRGCDYRKVLPCETPGGSVSATFNTPQWLGVGVHTLAARTVDAAGNVGQSAPQQITVSPAPQDPGPTTPATTPPDSTPSTSPPVTTPPTTPPGTTPNTPLAAGLRLRSVKRSGTTVRVRGLVAAGCRSRLRIQVRVGGRTRTVRITAPRTGRWGATIKGVRRGAVRVSVRASASPTCRSAAVTKK